MTLKYIRVDNIYNYIENKTSLSTSNLRSKVGTVNSDNFDNNKLRVYYQ